MFDLAQWAENEISDITKIRQDNEIPHLYNKEYVKFNPVQMKKNIDCYLNDDYIISLKSKYDVYYTTEITEYDFNMIFYQSIMTQIDEVKYIKILKINIFIQTVINYV